MITIIIRNPSHPVRSHDHPHRLIEQNRDIEQYYVITCNTIMQVHGQRQQGKTSTESVHDLYMILQSPEHYRLLITNNIKISCITLNAYYPQTAVELYFALNDNMNFCTWGKHSRKYCMSLKYSVPHFTII